MNKKQPVPAAAVAAAAMTTAAMTTAAMTTAAMTTAAMTTAAMTPPPAARRARRFGAAALAALAALVASPAARAQHDEPAARYGDTAGGASGVSYAAGVSMGFLRTQELGAIHRFNFIPSLVGFAYVPVAPRLFLRPGLRFGYSGLQQARFSHGAVLEEHSWQGSAELSVEYDAWLVPALGVGVGAQRREIDFIGRGIVQDSDALDRTEWLGLTYAQAGLGLPLLDGLLVIEPYARVQYTFSDNRSLLQLGTDISVSF